MPNEFGMDRVLSEYTYRNPTTGTETRMYRLETGHQISAEDYDREATQARMKAFRPTGLSAGALEGGGATRFGEPVEQPTEQIPGASRPPVEETKPQLPMDIRDPSQGPKERLPGSTVVGQPGSAQPGGGQVPPVGIPPGGQGPQIPGWPQMPPFPNRLMPPPPPRTTWSQSPDTGPTTSRGGGAGGGAGPFPGDVVTGDWSNQTGAGDPEILQARIKEQQSRGPTSTESYKPTYDMQDESRRTQIESSQRQGRGSKMNLLGQRIQQMSLAIQEARYKTLFAKRLDKMIGGRNALHS